MESNNPALRRNAFSFAGEETGSMTLSGAINKSGILFLIMMAGAYVGWNLENMMLGLIGALAAFGISFFLIRSPQRAPTIAPIYAALDGLFIGTISVFAEARLPGIAANAMTLTFGILGVMLACYRMGILRATPQFTRVVVFATIGIAIVYLANFVMSLFGAQMAMINQASPVGIAFSLIIAGVASLNLILDFDLFERQTAAGAPKYMEWYCGFALLVTIVWIYVEMLRLLSKLNRR